MQSPQSESTPGRLTLHQPQQQEQSVPINLVARQLPIYDHRVENANWTGSMRLHILPSKVAKINR